MRRLFATDWAIIAMATLFVFSGIVLVIRPQSGEGVYAVRVRAYRVAPIDYDLNFDRDEVRVIGGGGLAMGVGLIALVLYPMRKRIPESEKTGSDSTTKRKPRF